MNVAVIGSRGLVVNDLENYLPADTTCIVSGGARGIDTCARNYALSHRLELLEFLPIMMPMAAGRPFGAISPSSNTPIWCWRFGMVHRAAQNL